MSAAVNVAPLSPIGFLRRTAEIWPGKLAVVDGARRFSYAELAARAARLGAALAARGLGPGDTVAVIAPNTHMLLEAHFGVGLAGCVLNAINTRLDAEAVAYMLRHGEARLLLADESCEAVARDAAGMAGIEAIIGDDAYEALLATGREDYAGPTLADERDPIALNYTSGTTGQPKGVVYHHRGACLNAMSNALAMGLGPDSVYLWTLPMFHCNGWSHPWAVTLAGGTHICLREVRDEAVFAAIAEHKVTHMAGAPVVLNMLANAMPEGFTAGRLRFATGGAPPPSRVIDLMEASGFEVIHLYGQTETYGPSLMCFPQPGWADLPPAERAALKARQGWAMPAVAEAIVADPETCLPVPSDGITQGEIMVRGNSVMTGYLKDEAATAAAFRGGWLHSGDVAVRHPDGAIEIRDRSKDIIISGGENISSVEIENVLYLHPRVLEAAVVAVPHPKWGETPCAFVTLKAGWGESVDEAGLIAWCRERLAHFKCPTRVLFGDLPKTATGKIQKNVLRDRLRGGSYAV